ncbi:hypothetical protein [Dyadobacter sp. MSC1_007]|jgi:hypothetical protein|uniref:hypothetical protein n=1 Tax=Dyadobacter sp. MSC1_007 TaxID=2909264 RepID=UPI00202E28F0|nr:hypothetical protein [Dyadobacter sp. MSC1_007]
MELTILKIIDSPVEGRNQSIWAWQAQDVFVLADRWKVLKMTQKAELQTIWETDEEEVGYAMKGICDDRLPEALFEEIVETGIAGFGLLGKLQNKMIDRPNGSESVMEMVNQFGPFDRFLPLRAHQNAIILLGKKSISLASLTDAGLAAGNAIKTKGKDPLAICLHPEKNMLIYGTNYGELYAQLFQQTGFGKTIKIDNLQKPCFQVAFYENGSKLVACGMGFVKTYAFAGEKFTETAFIQTAARSFEIADEHLLLNKGAQGIAVFKMGENLQKVASIDLPFSIDRIKYLNTAKVLLATSNPSAKMSLISCQFE